MLKLFPSVSFYLVLRKHSNIYVKHLTVAEFCIRHNGSHIYWTSWLYDSNWCCVIYIYFEVYDCVMWQSFLVEMSICLRLDVIVFAVWTNYLIYSFDGFKFHHWINTLTRRVFCWHQSFVPGQVVLTVIILSLIHI